MRTFNTTGPCDEARHYMVPPLPRLPEARPLIEGLGYFVVHAPRQTGKTTTLRALAHALTAEGRYAALRFSCETAEVAGDDFGAAEAMILDGIRRAARFDLAAGLWPPDPWPPAPPGQQLAAAFAAWSVSCPRPLVLFLDEIDALRGESLRSVLRQLRDGFERRPAGFPAAVALCGLRDVRDYKAASGGDPTRLGTSSPFNVKVESLRLGDFDEAQVRALYGQHSAETGQLFTEEALGRAWALSQGQPWLANALGREIVEKLGVRPPVPITAEHVEEAKERLILARATHLDSLVARLREPRVQRMIEPLIAGTIDAGGGMDDSGYEDDFQYVRDLGLVAPTSPVRIANPIYREVVVRVLALAAERRIPLDPQSFVLPDGRLDFQRLLTEFADFWREHGEALAGSLPYHEVAPQLVLMAFLQRVVNGGGYVDREYGIGRGRIDLLVRWPYRGPHGERREQREAIEIKVWPDRQPDPLARGLAQIDAYLASLAMDAGTLVLFDRRAKAAPFAERTVFADARTPSGRAVTVLRA